MYACLVCGKYYQGRGQKSHAYTHSLEAGHHVYINLRTEKVYCLPDGYEINDPSLDDIRHVLNPRYCLCLHLLSACVFMCMKNVCTFTWIYIIVLWISIVSWRLLKYISISSFKHTYLSNMYAGLPRSKWISLTKISYGLGLWMVRTIFLEWYVYLFFLIID